MGDPKKKRSKYFTPSHPWQRARIEEERVLVKDYGLKNKREVWKMRSKVKKFADQVKKLSGISTKQAEKEKELLQKRLVKMGLLKPSASLGDALGLSVKDILERRLQTVVFRKGLAKSVTQARQFVSHGHVTVKGRKMAVPSYIVLADEEGAIGFSPSSSLSSQEHPERVVKK